VRNVDVDDFFEEMKKHFNFDSDGFDMDFFVMPEGANFNPNEIKDEDLKKGYKISYHFEKGMDKPEVKIEGDLDKEKLNEYMKKLNLNQFPHGHEHAHLPRPSSIDAAELSLEPLEPYEIEPEDQLSVYEPFAEVNNFDNFAEIILEAPGITKEDVIITFSNDGKALSFSARNGNRKYFKTIHIPFKTTTNSHNLDVNNGVITIKVFKS